MPQQIPAGYTPFSNPMDRKKNGPTGNQMPFLQPEPGSRENLTSGVFPLQGLQSHLWHRIPGSLSGRYAGSLPGRYPVRPFL